LMIHGAVDRALTFTMDDLKRLPSVTRMHFVECAGNRHNRRSKNVQESHGMTSCAEWTGVLLSTLLKEAGLKGSETWVGAEGAEERKGTSSIVYDSQSFYLPQLISGGSHLPRWVFRTSSRGGFQSRPYMYHSRHIWPGRALCPPRRTLHLRRSNPLATIRPPPAATSARRRCTAPASAP